MSIVMVLNLVTLTLMTCLVFGMKGTPLMTVGDAVAEFLDREDGFTKGCSLLTKHDFQKAGKDWPKDLRRWNSERSAWSRAGSVKRWGWCYLL